MTLSFPIRVTGRLVLAAGLLTAAGCATIARGTSEPLLIETYPAQVRAVILPANIQCTTPCSVLLKHKLDYTIKLEKEGYQLLDVIVRSKVEGAGAAGMAGNIVIGGLIGMGVDAATGATKGLSPNPVRVTMIPLEPTAQHPGAAMSAAPAAAVPVADASPNCIQPSVVDREACHGRLRLQMTKDEILALLGVADGRSRDDTTWRYGDRYLKFDAENRLIHISDKPL